MFIGREKELSELNRLYNSDKFEFAVIYGRRRVGKTALINEFIRDKRAIYFTGVETNAKQNLENFSKCIFTFSDNLLSDATFPTFQSALESVFAMAEKERIILVIDEYPYVARAERSLASTLQLLIDKYQQSSKLFLILCGSSMSYMEDHVLAYKAPLYGRRTAQFKISPFDFYETREYLKNASNEDCALFYGIVGGTPQYLRAVDDNVSPEENILHLYLNPTSAIFEEPANLLKQEVREPSIYNAIITAVATGASKLSEISSKVGEDTSVCATYIKNLIALGIIKKETPYGEKNSKKSIYSIEDNMFRFWYRFVPENNSLIARGASSAAMERIRPELSDYMGSVFEEICKQYLWRELIAGRCPILFGDIGRYWGTDSRTKSQFEIDIMGEESKSTALFAECKWRNEKVDVGVLEKLVERSKLFHYSKVHFYIFSKSGFTSGCKELAKRMGNVSLIDFSQIVG